MPLVLTINIFSLIRRETDQHWWKSRGGTCIWLRSISREFDNCHRRGIGTMNLFLLSIRLWVSLSLLGSIQRPWRDDDDLFYQSVLFGGGESGKEPHRRRDRSEIAPTRGCVIRPMSGRNLSVGYQIMVLLAILATFVPLIDPEKVNMVFLNINSKSPKSNHMIVPHSLQSVPTHNQRGHYKWIVIQKDRRSTMQVV